jgi:hypothetical protein
MDSGSGFKKLTTNLFLQEKMNGRKVFLQINNTYFLKENQSNVNPGFNGGYQLCRLPQLLLKNLNISINFFNSHAVISEANGKITGMSLRF